MLQKIEVHKFGGGAITDAAGIQRLERILQNKRQELVITVLSAIGKTTNLLENIHQAYYAQNPVWSEYLKVLINNHLKIIEDLHTAKTVKDAFLAVISRLESVLSNPPTEHFDASYDRIVCFGELLSSTIISAYLNEKGLRNKYLDARQLILTDHTYREGKVYWAHTNHAVYQSISEVFTQENYPLIITQGFIAGTYDERQSITLGREGSDYSAAIFAYSVRAKNLTIWKDVDGLFNADPKLFSEAVKLDAIPYEEAIELAYYGANIIHPKTIKPLQNNQIPLYIKSIFHPEAQGSVIASQHTSTFIPSFIFKNNQILISIYPKDFSFISVDSLSEIFVILSRNRLKINLIQNSALSFSLCLDDETVKIEKAVKELKSKYQIKYNRDVVLATIRHYNKDLVQKITEGKKVLAEQKNRSTIQLVIKDES